VRQGFWAFSLAFYARPGVSAACIALQDEHGADVDLILYGLWAASEGHCLSPNDIAAADRLAAPWRETVLDPIRRARRAMKPPPDGFDAAMVDALRRQVLAAELEAERVQHDALARHFAPGDAVSDPVAAARGNLMRYAAHVGIPESAAPLATLLNACAELS
jgi:uncharacterized protein (TIGR02444 family)